MASPVVGGAIALWLEANPNLNGQDVLDIIKKTSIPLDTEQDIPNNLWGYGKLDVYRGLLAALNLDGISDISTYLPQKLKSVWIGTRYASISQKKPLKILRFLSITYLE